VEVAVDCAPAQAAISVKRMQNIFFMDARVII